MYKLPFFISTFLLTCSLFSSEVKEIEIDKEVYTYHKETAGEAEKIIWTVEKRKEGYQIEGKSGKGETSLFTSPSYATKRVSYTAKNGTLQYMFQREGDYVYARQNYQGNYVERSFKVGEHPWIQEFDFAFKPFILSPNQSLTFYILQPRDLKKHEMIATKKEMERLQIDGKTYETQKVLITLTGFYRRFWNGQLWFDAKTGDLIKYQAKEGRNAPLSIKTLLSKEGSSSQ